MRDLPEPTRAETSPLVAGRRLDSQSWRWGVPTTLELLRGLSFGQRVAEEEVEGLSDYFVETDQWRRILDGVVDVVFGAKGSGKSAIYSSLLNRSSEMFDRGVLFVSGENPRGTTAFKDLVVDPPTSEREFLGLWKFYVLSLIAHAFEEYGISTPEAARVRDALRDAGISEPSGGRAGLLRRVREYMSRLLAAEAIEPNIKLDPVTGAPSGFGLAITLGEPSPTERDTGAVSVDDLFAAADRALVEAGFRMWVLFDRLDVAFEESRALEQNALRALFKAYLDTVGLRAIALKIFLRTDIWKSITLGGFREASHITRAVTIEWNSSSLLNLVVRRLVQHGELLDGYQTDAQAVLADLVSQRHFFDSLVPEKVDLGRNPETFGWVLNRVADGTKKPAPREVIHLLNQAKDMQVAMLERGENEPESRKLFSRQAFRSALPEVSRVRLEQTLLAEYPDLREPLLALEGEKASQTDESLAAIWSKPQEEVGRTAAELVDVGFFERRGPREDSFYWVPFLYRPALSLVQGRD
jgi:hypothetical protein